MAPKKKAGTRSKKAAKRSNRTGTRKTAKATARRSTARKSTARKSSSRKSSARKSTPRKSTARKSTARKSTTSKKSTPRKSITRKAARGVSTLRQSLARSLPQEGVGTAVKEKARQGFELAREGLERLKDTTVGVTATVIEGVKERISRDDDRAPDDDRRPASES
jgi:hypothetical protein